MDKMASQKHKSDSTIKELETEITGKINFNELNSFNIKTSINPLALTEQLIQSHTQTTDYDELMKQTAVLQNSMQDVESQNDILRKTIESYESRFSELQVQLEKIHFEVYYNLDYHNARNDVSSLHRMAVSSAKSTISSPTFPTRIKEFQS